MKRRDILKLAAAGAGLFFLPSLATREARAALRTDAPAKRLLIINLSGGIRSSAAFHASTQTKYNPYGLIDGTGTSRFALGKLLDDHARGAPPPPDADYTLGPAWRGERVPRLREIAKELSIIGSWDEERGDHIRARLVEPTGSGAGDQAGILTRLSAALTKERGNRPLDVLPFQLAPFAAFGQAGNLARFSPISLAGSQSLPVETSQGAADAIATGNDWSRDDAMRERLDHTIITKRARNAKTLAEVFSIHRRASRQIGRRLAEPWVNVARDDPHYRDAAFGTVNAGGNAMPLTNAMLYELFTKTLGAAASSTGEEEEASGRNDQTVPAMNGALALRLLQLGAPAICMEISGFDTHSQERTDAPALYGFLGRLWATLNWVMKRIPDPQSPNRSLFDTTLVMTMSDFGRDPGSNSTGYNAGEGSDHGSDPSCYYLAHAAMGGGVKGNRIVGEVSPDDYRGDRASTSGSVKPFGQQDVLAMMLWALGIDHKNSEWGFDGGVSAPLEALFQ